jgi:hypothetical protein
MDVMTRSELAEVLHELAGLVERPKAESERPAESFQGWLEAHGFVSGPLIGQWVLAQEDDVCVEIKWSPMDRGLVVLSSCVSDNRVAIQVFVSAGHSAGHMERRAIGLTEVSPSLTDLVDAMNGGALKREIDEAVDWDPELAI